MGTVTLVSTMPSATRVLASSRFSTVLDASAIWRSPSARLASLLGVSLSRETRADEVLAFKTKCLELDRDQDEQTG